ncbi:head-tail connector protein [Mammaliicoccus vitulinus]|uniref:head-tail connector protein n=1 Tax=Mammaliicoccus vitulinus TaxID=71237 RepID=UPI002B261304|nr:head-tail connector protein [Mammaliicoccus vitulinus]WQK87030.1 head-tail connector protein [Mammaliicoccus vitulinus]
MIAPEFKFDLNDINDVKTAIRVDEYSDWDDKQIMGFYLPAAKQKVMSAVTMDKDFYTSSEGVESLFNLSVLNHLANYYENRSITSQFEKSEIPANSLAIIQTLRGLYAVWKLADSSTE